MSNLLNLITELKNLGFTKEKVEEIVKLGEKDMADSIIEDFALNADEQVVNEYAKKFGQAQSDPQKLNTLLHEIIAIQYGQENILKKKEELLSQYLQSVIELAKQTKNVYQKYSQGDPNAAKIIEEAKKSPILQDFVKETQEEEKEPQDKG